MAPNLGRSDLEAQINFPNSPPATGDRANTSLCRGAEFSFPSPSTEASRACRTNMCCPNKHRCHDSLSHMITSLRSGLYSCLDYATQLVYETCIIWTTDIYNGGFPLPTTVRKFNICRKPYQNATRSEVHWPELRNKLVMVPSQTLAICLSIDPKRLCLSIDIKIDSNYI